MWVVRMSWLSSVYRAVICSNCTILAIPVKVTKTCLKDSKNCTWTDEPVWTRLGCRHIVRIAFWIRRAISAEKMTLDKRYLICKIELHTILFTKPKSPNNNAFGLWPAPFQSACALKISYLLLQTVSKQVTANKSPYCGKTTELANDKAKTKEHCVSRKDWQSLFRYNSIHKKFRCASLCWDAFFRSRSLERSIYQTPCIHDGMHLFYLEFLLLRLRAYVPERYTSYVLPYLCSFATSHFRVSNSFKILLFYGVAVWTSITTSF